MRATDVPADQIFDHGTKADLAVGDLIGPGYGSNFVDRQLNHLYFSATLWRGPSLSVGPEPPRATFSHSCLPIQRILMTRADPTADWSHLMFDASRLWADAGMVVALRSWRMMTGGPPAAQREVERMLSEKVEAGFELGGALAGGRVKSPQAAARKALGVYGKRVRGNRKRLS